MTTENTTKIKNTRAKKVPANSSLLVFPTDVYGITSDLKKACIKIGSKIGAQPEKLTLVKEVLDICLQHIEAKYEQNKKLQKNKVS